MALDFAGICRLCLIKLPKEAFISPDFSVKSKHNQAYNIYTDVLKKSKLNEKLTNNILFCEVISNCTKLKPTECDGLPNLICGKCVKLLKITYNFNIQCEESDNKLKKCLDVKDVEKEIIEEGELKELLRDGIKYEPNDVEVKIETISNGTLNQEGLEDYADDNNFWDSDDENLLIDLKSKKDVIKTEDIIEDGKPRKRKKGRPKKEAPGPPISKMPHQCDVCGKVISTKSNLKAHMVCHTDLRPYKCQLCPSSFRCYSGLFQHRKVHTKETPYHCEYCPKQFGRRTGLVNHVRIHTGNKDFTCDICFKTFTQSAQLYVHLKRHNGDKSFLCQVCGKGFPIKSDLRVHQRVHSGEKPYSCKLCSKTFATSGNLAIHVRIHNKEIRYHCKLCPRGFVTRSAFNVHVKRHQGRRDHGCDCGKAFYTSTALKQHKVVHTGEKKYSCKVCEKKFTQTSHMNRHMKKDHPKEYKAKVLEKLKSEAPTTAKICIERVNNGVSDVKIFSVVKDDAKNNVQFLEV